jgi:capsular polysaccharide biosynthesis protein
VRQETEQLPRPARRVRDLEEEREVDFGGYARTIGGRWWLVAAAVAVGLVVGYLVSVGGGTVYRAKATIYMGQPVAPQGGLVQGPGQNPATVSQIVKSQSVVQEVAGRVGIPAGRLRRGISTSSVAGAVVRQGQTPLVDVSVRGPWREQSAQAANLLAGIAVDRTSGYVDGKVEALEAQLRAQEHELDATTRRIEELEEAIARGDGLSPAERLSLLSLVGLVEQRRGELLESSTETRELLTLAENVERGKVVTDASPVKVAARSRTSSVLIGGLIGLIAGAALALMWDRLGVAERLRRRRRTT